MDLLGLKLSPYSYFLKENQGLKFLIQKSYQDYTPCQKNLNENMFLENRFSPQLRNPGNFTQNCGLRKLN